jgi:hypothetical protein
MTAKYSVIYPGLAVKVLAVETNEVRRGVRPLEGKALIDLDLIGSDNSEARAETMLRDFFRRLANDNVACADALDASDPVFDEATLIATGKKSYTAIVFFRAWHPEDEDSGPCYGSVAWQKETYTPRSASW